MKRIAAAAGLMLGLAWAASSMGADTAPVHIQTGLISGVPGKDPTVTAYLGVPYAAPPVGPLRWKAPAAPLPWQGVFKADKIGADCMQVRNAYAGLTHAISEDCLNLDLWTAAKSPTERRPVMVWVHGGGATGSGSSPQYDGEELAKKGVVLITLNFRMGVFADLTAPDLDKESGHDASGNLDVQDIIAALRWVHNNVAAFGGDPNRVTIFGQSAGAGLVDYVSMSPLAKGLFERTIAQSHVRYYKDPELFALPTGWTTKAAAEANGVKFEQATGAHSLAEMRAMPAEKLMEIAKTTPPGGGHVVDGYVIPHNNGDTYKMGLQNDVFYIAGDNQDESNASPDTAFDIFMSGKKPGVNFVPPTKLSDYVKHAHDKFGSFADEFLKLYPATTDREAFHQSSQASRDSARVSSWLWVQLWKTHATHPVYTYTWTHAPPGPNHDFTGAYHGSEIAYIYDHPSQYWTDEDRRISNIMSSYWVNFAKTGNPNGPNVPNWPAWDGKSQVMEIGDHFAPIPLADPVKVAFWKTFFAAQSGNRPPPSAYAARAVRE